jgi:hypothetical protein
MSAKKLLIAGIVIITLLAAACEDAGFSVDPLLPQTIPIDPTFREFYDYLGGEEILGPGISPIFEYRNVYYQYTVAALMVHDPGAPARHRFSLAPLGVDMGISEPPVSPPAQTEFRYVDGHIINSLFVPIYEKLGGTRYVGAPITEVHYNPERGRYEQFFANLGFYWLEGYPSDEVYLLAYGAWKCDAYCRSPNPEASNVVLPQRIAKRFASAVERLGADFTGYAITEEYETPDGYIEQVLENVVLVMDPQQPGRVFLRALTERLGYRPDPLNGPNPGEDYKFYPIQGERGYSIPQRLHDYIIQHGGFEISGPPISEVIRIKDLVYQQCFTNLCIQAFLDAMGNIVVRPAPLGYTYRLLPIQTFDQTQAQPISQPVEEPPAEEPLAVEPPVEETPAQPLVEPEVESEVQPQVEPVEQQAPEPTVETFSDTQSGEIIVKVWESSTMIAPNMPQEIGVSVFEDGQPVINVEPDLLVTLPDGTQRRYYMYPTGSDGQTRLTIEPVDAPSGTLIPYQVCIYNLGNRQYCFSESFLIWVGP